MARPKNKNKNTDFTTVKVKLPQESNKLIECYAAKYSLTKTEALAQILQKIVEKRNKRKEAQNAGAEGGV